MSDLRELYQQVIVDHNNSPHNFCELQDANRHAHGYNPLCGDKLSLYLTVNDDDIITDAGFQGTGCAISVASASLMTDFLKGKTIADVKAFFDEFHAALTSEHAKSHMDFGKLAVLLGVKEFPARVKCATLAWHTMQSALENKGREASTE